MTAAATGQSSPEPKDQQHSAAPLRVAGLPQAAATPGQPRVRAHVMGAGIAGLACAAALTRQPGGHDVTVYERRSQSEAREQTGHGLMLMANGVAALRQLGAAGALRGATPLRSAIVQDERGRPLFVEGLTSVYCTTRSAIVEALAAALPSGTITYDAEASGIDLTFHGERPSRVTSVTFGSGAELEVGPSDLVIGAEGYRSPLCQSLNPGFERPRSRVTEIVMSTRAPALAKRVGSRLVKTVFREHGLAFGMLAPTPSDVLGFLQFDTCRHAPPPSGASASDLASFVMSLMPEAPQLVRDYLAVADFSTAHVWRPVDAALPPRLHCRNAIVVGDAAHPLLPFTSQGGSASLEDAVLLARHLDGDGAVAAGLARFAEARQDTMADAVEGGRRILSAFIDPAAPGTAPYLHTTSAPSRQAVSM